MMLLVPNRKKWLEARYIHTHTASHMMMNAEIGAISPRTPVTAGKPPGVPRGKEGFLWFQRKGGLPTP